MARKQQRRNANPQRKVLVVDDHPVFRQGLAQLIKQQRDLAVCGEAADAASALQLMISRKPDVAVVDVTLKGSDGIDLVKAINLRYPGLPVLVLSMHDESVYAEHALRAGARGYVMKQEPTEVVLAAIRRVLGGDLYLSESLAARMLQRFFGTRHNADVSPLGFLSGRELQVFHLLGEGLGTREIADRLHLGISTVESHRAGIKLKLKLKSATELMQHAVRWAQSE